jgi:signal transduction histidine kinase
VGKNQNSINSAKQTKKDKAVAYLDGVSQRLLRLFMGAWKRTALENKEEYRQLFLEPDISQSRIAIFFVALTIAVFSFGDYMFFGFAPTFFALASLRLALIVGAIFLVRSLKRARNYRAYDSAIFVYSLAVVASILLVNSTRPENFIPHIIVVDMAIFVFYLVIPNRFIFQALPALIFSLGEVAIISATFGTFDMPALITALGSLFFANLVGALAALQFHSYRWQIFQNVVERKDTDRLVAIGQTAGMIGHDIRNPLQAIVSELYIAKDALATTPHLQEKSAALESIELIEEQTDYISKIVSDLQDYARPLKPECKEVDLTKLVTSIFQTIHVPNNITLTIDVKGFPTIETDATLIRRALTNLVNNAIQAMPDGGHLQLQAQKTGQQAIIAVSDTGKGIPEEIKPKLFTPLVTTKAKGQGLGLVVVKRFVEALGATITFESEVGKGTTFTITLPLNK